MQDITQTQKDMLEKMSIYSKMLEDVTLLTHSKFNVPVSKVNFEITYDRVSGYPIELWCILGFDHKGCEDIRIPLIAMGGKFLVSNQKIRRDVLALQKK